VTVAVVKVVQGMSGWLGKVAYLGRADSFFVASAKKRSQFGHNTS